MSELTRKLLFSFEDVQEELAKQREQIAGEMIERLPEYTETEACKRAGFYYDRDDVIATIAGGGHEPNQVTKDAIEEARNQNDPR